MSTAPTYRDHLEPGYNKIYADHQRQFAENARECDKVTIGLIRDIAEDDLNQGRRPSVLDIGCSTGNLLRHLNIAVPGLDLTGGDMVTSILDTNRADPELSGMNFEEMNLLNLVLDRQFDVVTTSAVLFLFDDEEFGTALANIASALKPGGSFVAFELFHPFEQSLAIIEKSKRHPDGIPLRFRPYSEVSAVLEENGLGGTSFQPFRIQIDLPRPDISGPIYTYTVRTDDGDRLQFRGALYQPWCHLVARKAVVSGP